MANRKTGVEWRDYADAREFARGLGLQSRAEWDAYATSGEKPEDIPSRPDSVYRDRWVSTRDWLGIPERISMEEAREFARSHGIITQSGWIKYVREHRPKGVPSDPFTAYKNEGWPGWVEFLGTAWRPFEEAREYARSLGLAGQQEWNEWAKSDKRPLDIPSQPASVYKEQWVSTGDWLGTGYVSNRKRTYRPFVEAREFARSLGLKTDGQWTAWAKTDARPDDIPAVPAGVYKREWQGTIDWLGTEKTARVRPASSYRPFEEARDWARSLRLKYQKDWANLLKNGGVPDDIPTNPERVSRAQFQGFADWLGVRDIRGAKRPFAEAREFARESGIRSRAGWEAFSKTPGFPEDLPTAPQQVYNSEWQGWPDFLGTKPLSPKGGWRPFEEAREYIRALEIKNNLEWREWCVGGSRPDDIPTAPEEIYADQWEGWADWLGTVNKWNRNALLALLEDLRPQLQALSEAELYTILQQGGAMRKIRKHFDDGSPLTVLRDLQENEGAGIEEMLRAAVVEAEEAEDDTTLAASDGVVDKFDDELYFGGGLLTLASREALRVVDELAALPYGLDAEAAQYLVDNRVAALWERYTRDGSVDLEGEGGYYFNLIRNTFQAELEGARSIQVPEGWAFTVNGVPTQPNMMQRRAAFEVKTKKRVGNWSGVGSGKTVSAILSSRVVDARHTLVIAANATLAGWRREIRNAYPGFSSKYTMINYEKFQQPNRGSLVRRLVEAGVDFVVLDEVQLVKQRDKNASIRRAAIEGLLSGLSEKNPNLYVFGMSATPVINNLLEARKLLEITKGRSYGELEDAPTVNNALAVHRALMVEGFRYRPAYEIEMDERVIEVDGNHLLPALMASRGVLGVEQTILTAKLEAIEPYLRAGTMIYTHYVKGMIWPIRRYLETMGYTVGIYTGEDKSGLEPFLAGRVDILVGSKPVGTGLDGLQRVSNNLIILSPPWTSAEDEQIRGRLRRQGSAFGSVQIIIPEVVLSHEGEDWSWDRGRWNTIRFKRTLSDCALQGRIPEAVRISQTEVLRQSKKALEEWIKRVGREGPLAAERPELRIPLPPDVRRRVAPRHGDFSTMNNRWSNSNSSTVEARLKTNPEEWYLYHTLYRETRAGWEEQPAEHIASQLASRSDLVVGDFGCGECQLAAALPNHKVVGFDYVAVTDTVIEGDMAHTPLEDGTLGAVVFSLSLMGYNWRDYLVEANRTLKPFGLLFIAESARRWKDGALEAAMDEAGFVVLQSYQRGDFRYVQAVKRG
jgi:hypothetical protein